MSGRSHLQVAVTSLLFRVGTFRQDTGRRASSSYTTAIYGITLLSIRKCIEAYESSESEGNVIMCATECRVYVFSC
jgi:hypothetical protein